MANANQNRETNEGRSKSKNAGQFTKANAAEMGQKGGKAKRKSK